MPRRLPILLTGLLATAAIATTVAAQQAAAQQVTAELAAVQPISWMPLHGPPDGDVYQVFQHDGRHFLLTDTRHRLSGGSVLISDDEGVSWQDSGLNGVERLRLTSDGMLLAVTSTAVYASDDNLESWVDVGLDRTQIRDAAVGPDGMFVIVRDSVLRSADGGESWVEAGTSDSMDCPPIAMEAAADGTIFIGTTGCGGFGFGSGIYRWVDSTSSWTSKLATGGTIQDFLFEADGTIFVTSQDQWMYSDGGVFRRTAEGEWSRRASGTFFELASDEGILFAGTPSGVRSSVDGGETWTGHGPPLPVRSLLLDDGRVRFAGTFSYSEPVIDFPIVTPGAGLVQGADEEAWQSVPIGHSFSRVQALTVSGTNVFVGSHGGLWRLILPMKEWASLNTYLEHGTPEGSYAYPFGDHSILSSVQPVAGQTVYVFADVYGSPQLYRWGADDQLLTSVKLPSRSPYDTYAFRAADENVLVFGGPNGLYRSADVGQSWIHVDSSAGIHAVASAEGLILAGSDNGTVLVSTDTGVSWSPIGLPTQSEFVRSLAIRSGVLYASAGSNIYRSMDDGESWVRMGEEAFVAVDLHVSEEGDVITLDQDGHIWMFPARSQNWQDVTAGLPQNRATSMALGPEGYLYAGLYGFGVYRSTQPIVSGAHEGLPRTTGAVQVYPNPFESHLTLEYNSNGPTRLRAILYDLLGRKVAEVADGIVSGGTSTILIDGSGLAAGQYFLHVESNGKSAIMPVVRVSTARDAAIE